MIEHPTRWHGALLRKFSSTGHFRLLNQVRSELRSQPLIRDPITRELNLQAKPIRGTTVRTTKRPNALESTDKNEHSAINNNDLASSFKDRLNAIDMR